MVDKTKKTFFIYFDPVTRFFTLIMGYKIHLSGNLFHSIFPGIVFIDKLQDFDEGISFHNNGAMEVEKRQFFLYHSNGC